MTSSKNDPPRPIQWMLGAVAVMLLLCLFLAACYSATLIAQQIYYLFARG